MRPAPSPNPRTLYSAPLCFVGLLACGTPGTVIDSQRPPQTFDPPTAIIDADVLSGTIPFTTTFSAARSTGDGLTFVWTVDQDTASEEGVFEKQWLGSGSREVVLTVTDAHGSSATERAAIEVSTATCPVAGTYEQFGPVTAEALNEVSGLAHSRQNPGVLWVHNDARNAPALYALDASGGLLGVFAIDIDHGDWEDIAIGVDNAGEPVLYVGSVGNNDRDRETLSVLVVPEPVVPLGSRTDGSLPHHEMVLEFPGGPFDTESMMWDPQTGDLYLLTKETSGLSTLFRAAAPHDEPIVVLEYLTELTFGVAPLDGGRATTGAAISPLGNLIAVRTYNSVAYVWRRDASESFVSAFDHPPCPVAMIPEVQGESIDFSLDSAALLSVREGAAPFINRTALDGPLPE